ncbi:hypothetical protein [Azomonas macrocytogenes]|uniref:Uncharacterized protein n=1 Tax=Azomonas macrocytogenes TaxID=69962 RepID=A0A839T3I4_AZOMA|nr:hypothetical protein [Azomonas macrocytogenes]
MTPTHVAHWVEANPLIPVHVDCAIAVMLKILDGKCKMKPDEKIVMALLYDAVRTQPHERLDANVHGLIAEARANLDEQLINRVYEQRVLAETIISRPVMKGFKAMLRERGLLDSPQEQNEQREADT